MAELKRYIRAAAPAVCAAATVLSLNAAWAQQVYIYTKDGGFTQGTLADTKGKKTRVIRAERYTPTIWVDPDGCEHWVFDDGFEGYMTPHVTRDGKPVCRGRGN